MSRSLNPREKRLLIAVLGTLFIVANLLLLREYTSRRQAASSGLSQLKEQLASNKIWLNDQTFWEKRQGWLENHMPYTDSSGRSQGQLLEEIQTAALDAGLTVSNTTLLEPAALDHANEVAVTLRLRGDQDTMLRWLLTLQSPEKFQAIKALDLELDRRAREKTPQTQCNLTIARWFNPNPPPSTNPNPPQPPPTTDPSPEQDYDDEPINPLELSSPI